MDVFEAVKIRRSVRAYEEPPVPKEALERILDAGRIAPSASNKQPWHFIVITDSEKRKAISNGPYAKFVRVARCHHWMRRYQGFTKMAHN